MDQRGRKSAASLTIVNVSGSPGRISPRADMPKEVAQIFRELVAQSDPDHFRPADAPLLEAFAQAALLSRRAYAEIAKTGPIVGGKLSPWVALGEKADRSLAALGPKLRLAPSARVDAKTAGRRRGGAGTGVDFHSLTKERDDDDEK